MEAKLVVLVDSVGDYAVGRDQDEAREKYESDTGALNECEGFRLYEVTLDLPLPVCVELSGTVEEKVEATSVTVTEAKE